MMLDFHHRPTLLKSWLATLHGPEVRVTPRAVGPLPPWRPLLLTAIAWHVAYALTSYAGAMVLVRPAATGSVASALRNAGLAGTLLATVAIWWGAIAVCTIVWWVGVVRLRE